MSKSRVMIAQQGKQAHIRIEGRGTFENAAAFKQAYGQLLARGAKEFLIDLGPCETMDSTFVGILVGFGLNMRKESGNAHVIDTNEEIIELFRNMGLDRLFRFDPV